MEHRNERAGARQPERFDASRASMLDDRARLEYLPPETILELRDAPAQATMLDFGAGTGLYAEELLRLRPDLRVVAVDEQEEMLAHLRERAHDDRFVAGSPAILEQVAGGVQRVMAINVLHEIGDEDLRRLFRLVGPTANFLFVDWDAAIAQRPGPPADHVYDVSEAVNRLSSLGLSTCAPVRLTYHYALRGYVASMAHLDDRFSDHERA